MWLFYGAATKAFLAGHDLRVAGICLLGFLCYLLTIEFADASAFGCSGWGSVWRGLSCTYFGRHCENEQGGEAQGSQGTNVCYSRHESLQWLTALHLRPRRVRAVSRLSPDLTSTILLRRPRGRQFGNPPQHRGENQVPGSLKKLVTAYDELHASPLLPLPDMGTDSTRARIDSAVCEALDLPAIDGLRRLLGQEPLVTLDMRPLIGE